MTYPENYLSVNGLICYEQSVLVFFAPYCKIDDDLLSLELIRVSEHKNKTRCKEHFKTSTRIYKTCYHLIGRERLEFFSEWAVMKMAASRPRGQCFFTLVAFNSLFIGLLYYKKDQGWNMVLNEVFTPQPPQPSNPLIARSANNCNSFELNACQLTSGDGGYQDVPSLS